MEKPKTRSTMTTMNINSHGFNYSSDFSTSNTLKTYSELIKLPTFEERYKYLRLSGRVGEDTFGFDRYLNQKFYRSAEWKRIRDQVIVRDNGCDLGMEDRIIYGKILIHHMNPVSVKDILHTTDILLNPEYLICVTHQTHNAIHYGDEDRLFYTPTVRTPYDTCPWKQQERKNQNGSR